MMNMLAIVISLLCAGFVLFQRHFFGLPGQSREKQSKPGTSRSEPPHAKSLVPSSEILVSKSYRSGLERTGADWSGHRHRPGRRRCYICPGFGREVRDAGVEHPCRAALDRRRRRTCGAQSACRRPISASGSPRQSRTPRCGGSCDARRAGLRRERRHGRRHGRGAASHRQLRHPGLCLTRKRETT